MRGRHKMEEGRWKTEAQALQSCVLSLLSLILFCIQSSPAQDVGLTASSDRKQLRTGEPVWVQVVARVPANIDSIGPAPVDSAGMFQVLGVAKAQEPHAWNLELMTIDTGRVFISPLTFLYTLKGDTTIRRAYTNPLSFMVTGVDVAKDADIKEIKPPINAPWKWEDLWPYLLAALVLGGSAYAIWRYRKNHQRAVAEEVVVVPPVEAHVLALRELRILEEKKLWQQGHVKEYYSEVTEIVRRFFEGRWQIAALEMTTPEILAALPSDAQGSAMREAVRSFLSAADMVKFAKAQPTPADHARELEDAFTIVRAMTPPPTTIQEQPDPEAADVR